MLKHWWMQTGLLCSLLTAEQMNSMPGYLILEAALKIADHLICKRRSGTNHCGKDIPAKAFLSNARQPEDSPFPF